MLILRVYYENIFGRKQKRRYLLSVEIHKIILLKQFSSKIAFSVPVVIIVRSITSRVSFITLNFKKSGMPAFPLCHYVLWVTSNIYFSCCCLSNMSWNTGIVDQQWDTLIFYWFDLCFGKFLVDKSLHQSFIIFINHAFLIRCQHSIK